MTDRTEPARLFAKAFIKLQEPPRVDVEARPDGSVRVLPGEIAAGTATETETHTNEGTTTNHETTTRGGTTSHTSTGTTTSSVVRIGGKPGGEVVSGWEIRNTELPPPIDPASLSFELAIGPEGREGVRGPIESVELEGAPQVQRDIVDIFGVPSTMSGRLPGDLRADSDSDNDDDGDTDQESDNDSGGDSDNWPDDDSDRDAVAREGITLPFGAVGARPPFGPGPSS